MKVSKQLQKKYKPNKLNTLCFKLLPMPMLNLLSNGDIPVYRDI